MGNDNLCNECYICELFKCLRIKEIVRAIYLHSFSRYLSLSKSLRLVDLYIGCFGKNHVFRKFFIGFYPKPYEFYWGRKLKLQLDNSK